MGLHSQEVQADGLHGVVAFSFPTEVDRLANTNRSPTADPNGNALSLAVGHVVRQADTNDLYVVRTTSPLAYDQISGAAAAASKTVFVPFTGAAVRQLGAAGLDVDDEGGPVRLTRSAAAAQQVEVHARLAVPIEGLRLTSCDFRFGVPNAFDVAPSVQTLQLYKMSVNGGVDTLLGTTTMDLESSGEDQSDTFTPTGSPTLVSGEWLSIVARVTITGGSATGELVLAGANLTFAP